MHSKRFVQPASDNYPHKTRPKTQQQRFGPTITNTQEEQQKVREVELLFDRERPERSVDRVRGAKADVVQHE
jgi:hypothetical protein